MIEDWIKNFKTMWTTKNLDYLEELFAQDVEYWETPFKRLNSLEDIKNEWQVIDGQQNINLSLSLMSSNNELHVVKWDLNYDVLGLGSHWSGVYLIRLNQNSGKCNYFLQVGEKE